MPVVDGMLVPNDRQKIRIRNLLMWGMVERRKFAEESPVEDNFDADERRRMNSRNQEMMDKLLEAKTFPEQIQIIRTYWNEMDTDTDYWMEWLLETLALGLWRDKERDISNIGEYR